MKKRHLLRCLFLYKKKGEKNATKQISTIYHDIRYRDSETNPRDIQKIGNFENRDIKRTAGDFGLVKPISQKLLHKSYLLVVIELRNIYRTAEDAKTMLYYNNAKENNHSPNTINIDVIFANRNRGKDIKG